MRLLDKILDIFYPKYCLLCLKKGMYICNKCRAKFQYINCPCCPVCSGIIRSKNYFIHNVCKRHSSLDGLLPLLKYDEKSKLILSEAKFKYAKEVLIEMASMLKPIYSSLPIKIDYIVPVPLSNERSNFRGFNQSEILAKGISWKYKNILRREKNTISQTKYKRAERLKNLKNSFSINEAFDIRNKNIVLIDDVYTTGSTLQECAKVLKTFGANKVIAIVWAKD